MGLGWRVVQAGMGWKLGMGWRVVQDAPGVRYGRACDTLCCCLLPLSEQEVTRGGVKFPQCIISCCPSVVILLTG